MGRRGGEAPGAQVPHPAGLPAGCDAEHPVRPRHLLPVRQSLVEPDRARPRGRPRRDDVSYSQPREAGDPAALEGG